MILILPALVAVPNSALKKVNILKVKCNEMWTIFLFSKNLRKKSQLYQQEAESTLKNEFCANCGAQDTKIRRFARASRKRTRNGRAWSGNEIIGFVTSYLASSFSRPNSFLEIIEFVSRISKSLLTSRCTDLEIKFKFIKSSKKLLTMNTAYK